MNDNLRIEQATDGGLVLHLSNYAAHALPRRLGNPMEADVVENAFVDEAIDEIELPLQ